MSLVSTAFLANELHEPTIRVCDVRWFLPTSGRSARAEYAAGHIPGAVFVDLDTELASHDDGTAGRHPLPAPDQFVAAMRRHGIGPKTHVIAYDDGGVTTAGRLWWLLRAHGHEQVSVLEGGLAAWKAEGHPVELGSGRAYPPAPFESHWNAAAAVDLDTMRRFLATGALVLDARAAERYRGDVEPVDPRPGHIPGAVNLSFQELAPGGRLLPRELLDARLMALDLEDRPIIASCGSGVTACQTLFALDATGLAPFPAARLYVGSYSEWSRRADLPVAKGDLPGEPA